MKTHFEMMANYNEWANARLFRVAGTLDEALYRREVGAYFRSLHGTLNHLLVSDRIWMRRLTGTGDHPEQLNAILFDDFRSLRAARVEEDSRIIAFVQSLDESAFEEAWDYRTLNGPLKDNDDGKFSPICSIMKRTIAGRLMRFSRYWVSRSPNHWTCS